MRPPGRDGSRDDSTPAGEDAHGCLLSGAPLPSTRAHDGSLGCRQRTDRLRRVDAPAEDRSAWATDRQRRERLVAQALADCPDGRERSRRARRCADGNRSCRALGRGGRGPAGDAPILLSELLEGEVRT